MFWQEDEDKPERYVVPDEVVDLGFAIECKQLPIDHAWVLQEALVKVLPWLADEPLARVHPIHVAESSNGWMRPDDTEEQVLIPSKRTKLYIRLPKIRLIDTQALTGHTLSLGGYALTVGSAKTRLLQNQPVIFARHVAGLDAESEEQFLVRMAAEIQHITGIKIKKMLCGKATYLYQPQRPLLTRQLMIADLDHESSIKLQQHGLGTERLMGCGVMIPHKGIKAQDA